MSIQKQSADVRLTNTKPGPALPRLSSPTRLLPYWMLHRQLPAYQTLILISTCSIHSLLWKIYSVWRSPPMMETTASALARKTVRLTPPFSDAGREAKSKNKTSCRWHFQGWIWRMALSLSGIRQYRFSSNRQQRFDRCHCSCCCKWQLGAGIIIDYSYP